MDTSGSRSGPPEANGGVRSGVPPERRNGAEARSMQELTAAAEWQLQRARAELHRATEAQVVSGVDWQATSSSLPTAWCWAEQPTQHKSRQQLGVGCTVVQMGSRQRCESHNRSGAYLSYLCTT